MARVWMLEMLLLVRRLLRRTASFCGLTLLLSIFWSTCPCYHSVATLHQPPFHDDSAVVPVLFRKATESVGELARRISNKLFL
jgi:hypothetical protein